MVLRLKAWESRTPPNLIRGLKMIVSLDDDRNEQAALWGGFFVCPISAARDLTTVWKVQGMRPTESEYFRDT